MGMYIAISDGVGWATSSGVFDCIVEATRNKLNEVDGACAKCVYSTLDEQGHSFIALNDADKECFNSFYISCVQAMDEFPNSEQGRFVPPGHVPGIRWNWSEVLRLMRDDPRFLGER